MTQPINRQMDELILQLIDGVISDEGFGVLKQWIKQDPQAAEYYCRFLNDYAAVKMEISSIPDRSESLSMEDGLDRDLWKALAETEKTAPTIKTERQAFRLPRQTVEMQPVEKTSKKINKSLLLTAISSLAAFLMLAVYVVLNPRTSPPIVGTLTRAIDARGADSAKLDPGRDLRAGPFYLEQGLAEIRMDSGAAVILEGPAEVELQSVNSLFLRRGTLVATVGREAVGFVVNMPHGRVLDLGTEFAMQVKSEDLFEIHVFQGEVMFYPESDTRQMVLSAGHACSMMSGGTIDKIAVQPQAFVRSEEFASRVLAREGSDYHRWKASVFALHRDPSLRAHYVFDQNPLQRADQVLNAAARTKGTLNGLSGADGRHPPTWVQGRWPQKKAVRFERGKNQVILIPPDPALAVTGPITLSAWVYFPNETQMGGHLIACRQDNHVNFQFSVFDDEYTHTGQRNRFEFLRFDEQNRLWCHSKRFEPQPGQWYHFAVTHDNEKISFYVNGHCHEQKVYKMHPEPIPAEMIIGAMKVQGEYVLRDGDFDGVVDELMIFDRCLSGEEIEWIYQAGRPASK